MSTDVAIVDFDAIVEAVSPPQLADAPGAERIGRWDAEAHIAAIGGEEAR